VFLVLYWLAKREQPAWYVFGWYLVLTGAERLLVEFIRINPIWFAGLTQPQWVAIGSIILGTVVVVVQRGRAPVLMRPAAVRGKS
jgi:phosphatidylglycerol:prolipoprotein diacylglycerol transferase